MSSTSQVYNGAIATQYDSRVNSERWKVEQDAMVRELQEIAPGERVVDVAAGTGRWMEALKERGASAILLDASADMLAVAREKAKALDYPVEIIVHDATSLSPYPAADWLVSSRFFRWIPLTGVRHILTSAKQAGVRKFVIMARYVPDDSSPINKLRARLKFHTRNLGFLRKRDRPMSFMHSERDFRRVVAECGLTVERESLIRKLAHEDLAVWVMTANEAAR